MMSNGPPVEVLMNVYLHQGARLVHLKQKHLKLETYLLVVPLFNVHRKLR